MKTFLTFVGFIMLMQSLNATRFMASSVDEAITLLEKGKGGDSVLLKNGVYKDAVIKFNNSNGSSNGYVTFTAETPGKVFFEGNSTLALTGSYILVSGFTWRNDGEGVGTKSVIELKTDHSILSDCAVINYNSNKNIDNKWVSIYGEYNTVTRCLFKDKNNLGATLTVWLTPGREAHHTISYNYFNGRKNGPDADNGLESIRIGDSKTSFQNAHCVVALNRFEECDGEIEIVSNKSCYNSYLHNSFVNSDGGLTLRHGNNCMVDGNVFDGGAKTKSYGVRFIGEGHVAVNNYFYNLQGSPAETFRAPVTLVTGIVNTPINGYFQVRRAVVANNIFVNCAMPGIRVGATPKRENATLAPDTVTIKNNFFFDDKGTVGRVYEEIMAPAHLLMQGNSVIGSNLEPVKGFSKLSGKDAKRYGLERITDGDGKVICSAEERPDLTYAKMAGANIINDTILDKIKNRKYTLSGASDVGPGWMR